MAPATLAHLFADPASPEAAIVDDATGLTTSYRALSDQVERLAETLSGAGFGRGEAVALILPNGVELLVLCLALTRAGLIAAPLDPASTQHELAGLIADIQARAIVTRIDNAVAVNAATVLGTSIFTASLDSAGFVRLDGIVTKPRGAPAPPDANDVAFYLHTSGTSEKPKVVPLTHANVTLSARNIAAHYALTPADRSLVVVPLFHGHGLIGSTLSTLASGGAVIVPPRFSASRFWQAFHEHRATWYTAVPTIHQVLLERADADGAPRAGLRFIRSCSAPIADTVVLMLERRLGAPVIEAYGLTEASHQVASNPLPPRVRVNSTVGIPTGVQVALLEGSEIVLRGPTLTRGYRNNTEATAAAFADGWFRTGDIGCLDSAGYLRITGRIKDLINRGGEKISPVEIESVLLSHPAIAEAAVFPVPDPKYGEEVEAAVVLRRDADPETLRSFCRERLTAFKVPRRIRIVTELPKNALGKLKRHALTEMFAAPTPSRASAA
ncbi:MAG: AMP-binding protein [Pseudomonadota bacterium]